MLLADQTNGEEGGGGGYGSRRKFVDEYLYERLFLAAKPFTAAILKALALSRRDRDVDLDADCEKDLMIQLHARAPSPILKLSPRPQLDNKSASLSFPPRGILPWTLLRYILNVTLLCLFFLPPQYTEHNIEICIEISASMFTFLTNLQYADVFYSPIISISVLLTSLYFFLP